MQKNVFAHTCVFVSFLINLCRHHYDSLVQHLAEVVELIDRQKLGTAPWGRLASDRIPIFIWGFFYCTFIPNKFGYGQLKFGRVVFFAGRSIGIRVK